MRFAAARLICLGDCKTLALPFKFVFEVALPPQKLDFGEQSEPSRRPNERSECDQRESLDCKTTFYNRLIDLFVGTKTRPHKDLDAAVYWEDRDEIVRCMLDGGWELYEPTRSRYLHKIVAPEAQKREESNIWCVKKATLLIVLRNGEISCLMRFLTEPSRQN